MSRIITANKKGRIDNIEEFLTAVRRDMNMLHQGLSQLALLSEAHSRLLGLEKVDETAQAIFAEKRAAAMGATAQDPSKVVLTDAP